MDFFTLHDLFDTTQLHHEHVVAALGLFGLIAALIPLALGSIVDRERREWTATRGF
jgi:hypothetical protein